MIKYNISYIAKDGVRTLMGPAQGRYMKDTREEAKQCLKALMENSEEKLIEIYGPQSRGTFRVDEFDCWDHGDPKSIYIK